MVDDVGVSLIFAHGPLVGLHLLLLVADGFGEAFSCEAPEVRLRPSGEPWKTCIWSPL